MTVILNELNMCDTVATLKPGEDAYCLQYLQAAVLAA